MSLSAVEMTKTAVECLKEKKAENIQIIDISSVSSLGDYFIIANGTNRNQIQALSDNIQERLGKEGVHPKQVEGYNNANWVLLDYRDIIVHIFDKESRSFYDLERIWRDGVIVQEDEL